ncbi:hypothetical protein [Kibdelosporangium phytohabitans]|uniref:hypothetical protein n=1 Tax=Kibdelosporangium phytohabitans TaxID=860235 RepID=UPI0012F97F46|nr:hypothetical protein [Kibdelosporangium phytohabitans]MBE1470686.1 hypothetical protein [Kibdelosporangium phytohabitans]
MEVLVNLSSGNLVITRDDSTGTGLWPIVVTIRRHQREGGSRPWSVWEGQLGDRGVWSSGTAWRGWARQGRGRVPCTGHGGRDGGVAGEACSASARSVSSNAWAAWRTALAVLLAARSIPSWATSPWQASRIQVREE